jgi:protein TonB
MQTHSPQSSDGRGDRPLFDNLLASRPRREGRSAVAATATSVVGHAAAVAALVWATMAAGQIAEPDEDVTMLIPVQEEEPPPPPPPPPPPEVRLKEVPPVEVPRGFQTLTVPQIVLPDIPPPRFTAEISERDFSGEGVEGGRADGTLKTVTADNIEAAPSFTPFTVEPRLQNTEEVARQLQRSYPPLLRDAGIGGTVVLWFLIDEQGKVIRTQVHKGSGYQAFDEAAGAVAAIMEFSPAMNRDTRVKVWVQIPVSFTTK